jgi:hypothetical protein
VNELDPYLKAQVNYKTLAAGLVGISPILSSIMSELQSPSSSLVATDHAVKESGDTVEMSKISAAPETLAVDKPTAAPQTKSQVRKERIAIATLCWCLFLLGWSDGATGPLLPRIQEQ